MLDREKVIKDLEFCVNGRYKVELSLATKILALLKEQDEDKPKGHWIPREPDKRGYTGEFECSRCERIVLSDHYCKMIDFDFCPYCGAYMDNAEGWWGE